MTGPTPDPAPAGAPSPSLGPDDVVLAQLAGLQREPFESEQLDSEQPGEGLRAAWQFASPGNRAATGPLPRFARMLRADAYRGLLGHRTAHLGPLELSGADARMEVLVVAADDSTQGFTWVLGRQTDGMFAGCWMTDGVVRHPEARA